MRECVCVCDSVTATGMCEECKRPRAALHWGGANGNERMNFSVATNVKLWLCNARTTVTPTQRRPTLIAIFFLHPTSRHPTRGTHAAKESMIFSNEVPN